MAGFPASYLGISAFSETDFNEDLKKFDVPTLIMHGDDDQVVPIAALGAPLGKDRQERDPQGLSRIAAWHVSNAQGSDQCGFA